MQNKEIEEDGFSIDLEEEQTEDFKKVFGLDELEEIHKRFENGTETIDDIKKHCLNYMIKTESGVELKLVETKYFEKLIEYIDQLESKVKELSKGQYTLMQSRRKWKNRYYKERRKRKEADKAVEQIYDDYQDIGNMYFNLDEKRQQVIAIINEYINCLEKDIEITPIILPNGAKKTRSVVSNKTVTGSFKNILSVLEDKEKRENVNITNKKEMV